MEEKRKEKLENVILNCEGDRYDILDDVISFIESSDKITQEEFNTIGDLRYYLLGHPDVHMVKTACLHYLGDDHQELENNKKEYKIWCEFDYGFNLNGNEGIYYGTYVSVLEIAKQTVNFAEDNPEEFDDLFNNGLLTITEFKR